MGLARLLTQLYQCVICISVAYASEASFESVTSILTSPIDSSARLRRNLQEARRCSTAIDCYGGYAACIDGFCQGFLPDLNSTNIIECVDGYMCKIPAGRLITSQQNAEFRVRAIHPDKKCGEEDALTNLSSFFIENEWSCNPSDVQGCIFDIGVGFRSNKTNNVETIRLCGCPGLDVGKDTVNCNQKIDFFVPIGLVTMQQCTSNAHCDHQIFANCVNNTCNSSRHLPLIAGLKFYECMTNNKCTFQSLANNYLGEAFKILSVQDRFTCGSQQALDPDYIKDNALPCLFDVGTDGKCEVNLGVRRTSGHDRLCGCAGVDLGGDGIPCNQLEDFGSDIGIISLGECSLRNDCQKHHICFGGNCYEDKYPPTVTKIEPRLNTYTVPPMKEITIEFNENIFISNSTSKIILKQNTGDSSKKGASYVFTQSNSRKNKWEIKNYILRLFPNQPNGLPAGSYELFIESNFIKDQNENIFPGMSSYNFFLSKNAGCPYLYATGFFPGMTQGFNVNGEYVAIDSINMKAAWKGNSEHNKGFYIYWSKSDRWVIGKTLEDSDKLQGVIAYNHKDLLQEVEDVNRPFNGNWYVNINNYGWFEHPVHFTCTDNAMLTKPSFVDIYPPNNSIDFPINGTIKLTFDSPVFYGHSGRILLEGKYSKQVFTYFTDAEKNMRDKYVIADGSNVVKIVPQSNLFFGETYSVSIEEGAFTSIYYNPIKSIASAAITFRSYGIQCSEYPALPVEKYIVRGDGIAHGSVRYVTCPTGMSPPKDVTMPFQVTCDNGKWTQLTIKCYKNCQAFPTLDNQYRVNITSSNNHDSTATVSCSQNSTPTKGTSPENVTCNNGVWSSLVLRCGNNCGAFPDLGPNYEITGSGIKTGSTRLIKCSRGSQAMKGIEPDLIKCVNGRWSTPLLQCNNICLAFPNPGVQTVVSGGGYKHGDIRTITCEENHTIVPQDNYKIIKQSSATSLYGTVTNSEQDRDIVVSTCIDGLWSVTQVTCMRSCPEFNPGKGFVIKGEDTGSQEGSYRELYCKEHAAVANNARGYDKVTCIKGAWTTHTLECKAVCEPPEVILGPAYKLLPTRNIYQHLAKDTAFTADSSFYLHGTMAKITCSTSDNLTAGTNVDEFVVCIDGQWNNANNINSGIQLQCRNSCAPLELPPGHVVKSYIQNSPYHGAHGNKLTVQCDNRYISTISGISESIIMCNDGKWEYDVPDFSCKAPCKVLHAIMMYNPVYYTFHPSISALESVQYLAHQSKLYVGCINSTSVMIPNRSIDHQLKDIQSSEYHAVTCIDGVWERNNVLCIPMGCDDGLQNRDELGIDCGGAYCSNSCPTCEDGIQNGDETDVDCGGSCPILCPETCSDKVKNRDEVSIDCGGVYCPAHSLCPPSCADNVKNGDELGVDCGGSCNPCLNCMQFSLPRGVTFVPKWDIPDINDVIHSTPITVKCAPEFYPKNVKNGLTEIITCENGQWSVPKLGCEQTSCTDNKQNGDETGVDCGGSCENACFTCNDGIMNGDETGIDCGGSCPSICSRCSLFQIKNLISNPAYIVKQESSFYSPYESHRIRWSIECAPVAKQVTGKTSQVIVTCIDGVWTPALNSLECVILEEDLLSKFFFGFPVSLFSMLHTDCQYAYRTGNPVVEAAGEPSRYWRPNSQSKLAHSTTAVAQYNNCCDIRNDFLKIMIANDNYCSNLIYSESFYDIGLFCDSATSLADESIAIGATATENETQRGEAMKCGRELNRLLQKYMNNNGAGCNDYIYIEMIVNSYCGTDGNNNTCFQDARKQQDYLSNFKLANVSLNVANEMCATECYSSNIRYFHALLRLVNFPYNNDMIEGSSIRLPKTNSSSSLPTRTLMESVPIEKKVVNSAIGESPLNHLLHDENATTRQLQSLAINANSSSSMASLSSVYFFNTPNAKEPVLRGYISDFPDINTMQWFCIRSDGKYCYEFLNDVISKNPILYNIPSQVCGSSCVSFISRIIGSQLLSESKKNFSPYNFVTGSLLRAYGRHNCSINSSQKRCGDMLFPNSENLLPRKRTTPISNLISPSCPCSNVFIGDGICDDRCFTKECLWDMGDCSIDTMYGNTVKAAFSILGLSNLKSPCNPLTKNFVCQSTTNNCKTLWMNSWLTLGCCWNAAFEVYKDITRYLLYVYERYGTELTTKEEKLLLQNNVLSMKYSGGELYTNSIFLDSLNPKTPLELVEIKCNMTIEKQCINDSNSSFAEHSMTKAHYAKLPKAAKISSALAKNKAHNALKLTFYIQNVDFEKVITLNSSNVHKNLQNEIQNVLSSITSLPPNDILLIQIYDGSLGVDATIQAPPVVVEETFHLIQRKLKSGKLVKELTDFFILDYKYLLEHRIDKNILLNIPQDRILIEKIVLPDKRQGLYSIGTVGLQEYDHLLVPVECPASLPLPLYPIDNMTYNPLYQVFGDLTNLQQGATRTITCNSSLSPADRPSQILRCENGRWAPPKGQKILTCHLPCQGDPPIDLTKYILISSSSPLDASLDAPESIVSKITNHSQPAHYNIKCREDFQSSNLVGVETLSCTNGQWTTPTMKCTQCKRTFLQALLGDSYHINHIKGLIANIQCADGYLPLIMYNNIVQYTKGALQKDITSFNVDIPCLDGHWIHPNTQLVCNKAASATLTIILSILGSLAAVSALVFYVRWYRRRRRERLLQEEEYEHHMMQPGLMSPISPRKSTGNPSYYRNNFHRLLEKSRGLNRTLFSDRRRVLVSALQDGSIPGISGTGRDGTISQSISAIKYDSSSGGEGRHQVWDSDQFSHPMGRLSRNLERLSQGDRSMNRDVGEMRKGKGERRKEGDKKNDSEDEDSSLYISSSCLNHSVDGLTDFISVSTRGQNAPR